MYSVIACAQPPGSLQLEPQLKLQHRCFPTFITSAPRARPRLYEEPPSAGRVTFNLVPRGWDPFDQRRGLVHLLSRGNCAHACSDCLKQRSRMLWLPHFDRVDKAGRTKSVYMEKRSPGWEDDPTIAFKWPNQRFVVHVNGSPRFVRKWKKSWLALSSLGRQITRRKFSP